MLAWTWSHNPSGFCLSRIIVQKLSYCSSIRRVWQTRVGTKVFKILPSAAINQTKLNFAKIALPLLGSRHQVKMVHIAIISAWFSKTSESATTKSIAQFSSINSPYFTSRTPADSPQISKKVDLNYLIVERKWQTNVSSNLKSS